MKVLVGNVDCEAQCGEPGKRTQEMRIDDIPCSHRLLWLAEADDLLVLPAPLSKEMLEYASGLIPVGGLRQVVASTQEEPICLLTEATLDRDDIVRSIAEKVSGPIELVSYFPDRGATNLARRLGASFTPSSDEILELNKKSVFREIANDFGIPIAPGRSCRTADELFAAMAAFLEHTGEVVVKQDLAGGGEGNVVVTRLRDRARHTGTSRTILATDSTELQRAALELFSKLTGSGNEVIVVEAYFENEIAVCAELLGSGTLLTWGLMRMEPMFRGFELPFGFALADDFLRLSETLAKNCRGYSGRLNCDAFVSPDCGLIFSEVNVRLGGCTHIDVLCRRLFGDSYLSTKVVHARNKVKSPIIFSELVKRLPRFDKHAGTGVIVLQEDVDRSHNFEYMAVGRTREEAFDLERGIQSVLGVSVL